MKDASATDLNTPGFEPVTQWSEVGCSTAHPSALSFQEIQIVYLPKDSFTGRYALTTNMGVPTT